MLLYDSLEDAQSKLTGTICYYEGKAVLVKAINLDENNGRDYLVTFMSRPNGRNRTVLLTDANFNYMQFNLGYSNDQDGTVWWFRKPVRQYRQGLKGEQMGLRSVAPNLDHVIGFNYSQPICNMMENIYPSLPECEKILKDQDRSSVAFHRDFAISLDRLHRDILIEHRGVQVGVTANYKDFILLDEFEYLEEAIKEVIA